jgi:hypothetical protein
MSARLRDVEDMLTQLYASHETAGGSQALVEAGPSVEAAPSLALSGSTYAVQFLIGPKPIPIPRLPFAVGRQPGRHEPPSVIAPDLAIAEDEPHRLSRAHFSLIRDRDAILVRDLGSTLGTIVNGRPLGHAFPVDSEPVDRQGRRAGGRGADHDRARPGRRGAGGDGLQLADPPQQERDGACALVLRRPAERAPGRQTLNPLH